jgi:hypothetical protein
MLIRTVSRCLYLLFLLSLLFPHPNGRDYRENRWNRLTRRSLPFPVTGRMTGGPRSTRPTRGTDQDRRQGPDCDPKLPVFEPCRFWGQFAAIPLPFSSACTSSRTLRTSKKMAPNGKFSRIRIGRNSGRDYDRPSQSGESHSILIFVVIPLLIFILVLISVLILILHRLIPLRNRFSAGP